MKSISVLFLIKLLKKKKEANLSFDISLVNTSLNITMSVVTHFFLMKLGIWSMSHSLEMTFIQILKTRHRQGFYIKYSKSHFAAGKTRDRTGRVGFFFE